MERTKIMNIVVKSFRAVLVLVAMLTSIGAFTGHANAQTVTTIDFEIG